MNDINRKVLLIEDNPGDARLIGEMLKYAGGEVVEMSVEGTLADGIRALTSRDFDVILLDLGLPDSSGLGTLIQISDVAPAAPVVILTGLDDDAIALEAVRSGAQDYLVKGRIDGQTLIRVIDYAIERKTLEEELRSQKENLEELVRERTEELEEANRRLTEELAERKKASGAQAKSEERYRDLYEEAPNAYFSVGVDGLIKMVNKTACEMLGYRKEELLGKKVFDLYSDVSDGRKKAERLFEKFLSGEEITKEWMVMRRADGEDLWTSLTVKPMFDEGGNLVESRSLVIDVTDRKATQQALEASERKFRTIFERSPIGKELYDSEGRLVEVNEACLKIFGVDDASEVEGFRLFEDPNVSDFNKERLRKGRPVRYETWFDFEKVKENQLYATSRSGLAYLEVSITPLGGDGAVEGYLVQVIDSTRRKLAEQALTEALESSRKREKEVSAFLEATTSVLELPDFESSARAIFESCKEVTGAMSGYIALLSEDGQENEVLFLDAGGLPCDVDPALPMPIRGLRAEAYQSGSVVYDNDFMHSRWVEFMPEGHVDLENVLFAPLKIEGETVGIMGLANKAGGFDDVDARVALGFADVAAVALSKSRATELLRESEERYRDLFDTASDLIQSVTPEGEIVYVNRAWRETLGYSEEELEDLNLFDIIHPESIEHCMEVFKCVLEGEEAQDVEATFVSRDGRKVHVIGSANCRFEEGRPVNTRGIFHDVTELREAERELAREKEFTELALDSLYDAFYVLDPGEARFIRWNSQVEQASGYSADELKDMTVFDLIDPADAPGQLEYYQELLENGVATTQVEAIARDGTRIPYETYGTLIRNEDGGPMAVVSVGRDVTERRRAQKALQEAERRYRELAESLPQIVFEMDFEGRITYVNEVAYDMFGYTKEDIEAGIQALDLIDDPDKERVGGAVMKMVDGTSDGAVRDYTAVRKDGSTFPCRVYSALITDENGERAGIRGILTDITEEKKAERELMRTNAELDGFAHTVSHDLKGPLSSIKLGSDTLEALVNSPMDDETMSDIEETAGIIGRNVYKSIRLIEDLLELAEAGQEPTAVEEVDVRATVDQILFERSAEVELRGIDVRVDGELLSVVANPTHIYQVFTNLIGNAIKHNDSEEPVIEVKCLGEGDGLKRYLVRDNGSGIPEEDLKKVFLPFFKGKTGETGIGLSTVEKIVEIYGGSISAYNDGGACFEFSFKNGGSGGDVETGGEGGTGGVEDTGEPGS